MSDIKWCDTGGHAFSANDPDRKEYAATSMKEGTNRERIDVCGPCQRNQSAFIPMQNIIERKAVDPATVVHDSTEG